MILDILDLAKAPSPAYAYCVYSDGVEFGTFDGNAFSFGDIHTPELLLEIHIFNCEKEYRAVYSQTWGKFIETSLESKAESGCAESVLDLGGQEHRYDYIDEYLQLFGEEYLGCEDGITVLRDKGAEKKFYLALPQNRKISIGVRNYLGYDENQMIFLKDYRLTGLYTLVYDFAKKEEHYDGLLLEKA